MEAGTQPENLPLSTLTNTYSLWLYYRPDSDIRFYRELFPEELWSKNIWLFSYWVDKQLSMDQDLTEAQPPPPVVWNQIRKKFERHQEVKGGE